MLRKFTEIKSAACFLLIALVAPAYAQNAPPTARVENVTDDYFGTKVVDPYRWMEDLRSDETQKWMRGQADYADAYLKKLPLRDVFFKRLNELSDAGVNVGGVRQRGERVFYYKQLPGENNRKLYFRDGLSGAERLLVDPEKYAASGGQSTISDYSPSPDGKLVSYLIALGGGEYGTIRVLDVATGKEIGDVIENTRWTAGDWTQDSRAFAYVKFQTLAAGSPPTEKLSKIRSVLHVVGTKSETDKPLFGYGVNPNIPLDPSPFGVAVFPLRAKYSVVAWNSGVSPNSDFYVAPVGSIQQTPIPWRKIISLTDEVRVIAEHGDYFYALTYKNTPRYKIVRFRAASPDLSKAETVFGASDAVIVDMAAAKDALYVQTLDGGSRRVFRVDYKTFQRTEVKAPYKSSVFVAYASPDRDGVLLSASSWTKSNALFAYDPKTGNATDTKLAPPIPVDMSDVEVVNAKAKSYDGVMIPLVILHKKGLKLDGSNPTLMDGYGAYGIENVSPFFMTYGLPWLERGGVYVWTGIRGGGEYGEEWHMGGFQKTKPNTWKDFIACAEYLIANKYTSPQHLGIQGGSAGGILISNSIAERPDLFGAALSGVGLNNALRSETTANGVTNIPEFGTFKTKEGFESLLAMDGYHKIRDGTKYPAVLLTHGVNDPRVEPWMSAKFAARLQAATASGKPVLLRLNYDAGHGIGSSRKQQNEEQADVYAFMYQHLTAINR